MNQNPGNYLRAHRKRSGLSQQEVAAILGCGDAAAVSRYEWTHSLPPLPIALAFEVVFMVPVSQLFSGLHEAVGHSVEQRLSDLEAELGSLSGRGPRAVITARKLEWLVERRRIRTVG
jgi:transcriptional regulator with XRE-family HTH domain